MMHNNRGYEVVGECGDCGHPIYLDKQHYAGCGKPSEAPQWPLEDDYRSGMTMHGGSWHPNFSKAGDNQRG